MRDIDTNVILIKSKKFAVRCIRMYQWLNREHREFIMSKQLLRSGTSIGANIKEALRGQTRPDFGTKMNLALKEASETEYWLELLYETDYINITQFESIVSDCRELIRILTAIVKSTFASYPQS